MTEQPEPTRPLDMSKVFDQLDEEPTPPAPEAKDGAPAPDGSSQ